MEKQYTRDEFVAVSIRKIGDNAYKDGELIELGAVKFNLKNKKIDTFYVVNKVDYEFSDKDFQLLGFNKSTYDSEKQESYIWMYKFTEFIENCTIVTHDAYELYNYLKSLGLELHNLLDLKAIYFLTDKKMNVDLEYHMKKNKIMIPKVFRTLRKPIMLKDLFLKEYKKRIKRNADTYINLIYVNNKKDRYRGVTDGYLIYSDGRREYVEDIIEDFDKKLSARKIYEESILGDDLYKVVEHLKYLFEDIVLDTQFISPIFFRVKYNKSYYIWSPLGLYEDIDFELIEIYDLGKISHNQAKQKLIELFEDTELYEFSLKILKFSNPNYIIQTYDYFKEDIQEEVNKIVKTIKQYNSFSYNYREMLWQVIKDRDNYGMMSYIINTESYNILIDVLYDDLHKIYHIDKEGNVNYTFEEMLFNEIVEEQGYIKFRENISRINETLLNTILNSYNNIGTDEAIYYGNKIKNILGEASKIEQIYRENPQISNEFKFYGYIADKEVIFVNEGKFQLNLGIDGNITVINKESQKTHEIQNLYDLYKFSGKFYTYAKLHYQLLNSILNSKLDGNIENSIIKPEIDDDINLFTDEPIIIQSTTTVPELDIDLSEPLFEDNYTETTSTPNESLFEDNFNDFSDYDIDISETSTNENNDDYESEEKEFGQIGILSDFDGKDMTINELTSNVEMEYNINNYDNTIKSLPQNNDDLSLNSELEDDSSNNEVDLTVEDVEDDTNIYETKSKISIYSNLNKAKNIESKYKEYKDDLDNMEYEDFKKETIDAEVFQINKFIVDDFNEINMRLDALSKLPEGFYPHDKKGIQTVIKNIKAIVFNYVNQIDKLKLEYIDGSMYVESSFEMVYIQYETTTITISNNGDYGIKIN